jgi:hypothetical protein
MKERELTAFEKKTGKYETFVPASESWEGFLNQCKRAVNKLHGFKVGVKYDFWSCRIGYNDFKEVLDLDGRTMRYGEYEDLTYWEFLKKTGFLSINDGFHCIDFDSANHVFAGYSGPAYVDMEIVTAEELREFMDVLFKNI